MRAMEQLCQTRNGDMLVIPHRYKNPTSKWEDSQANAEWWDPIFTPYLCNQRKRLNKKLVVMGDVKVQPTAQSPLTGFEALTHGESGILGHTKLQLRTIATPQSRLPKILTTTGAATVANYTDTKAGKLGEFHHTLGACLVELKGKKFHVRQINADKKTGAFIDLNEAYGMDYSPVEMYPTLRAAALVMGDTHVDAIDPKVERATREMVEFFNPDTLVYHDLNDDYAVNAHHAGNPFILYAKIKGNRADARAELERAIEFVVARGEGRHSVIVPSNHNDFLSRWIMQQDWKAMPGNAEFYLETALAMLRGTTLDGTGTTTPDPFTHWARKLLGDENVRVLERDESLQIAGIELGLHGDKGPNGARGSRANLKRVGVKSIIGHSHSPGIDEGCYQVGTSTHLKLEYTSGPSSWLNTHCIVYANGKRSLINIIDGEWRLT